MSVWEGGRGSAGDVIRLVCGGQCCQKGVGGQREPCLQTVCVYIPDGERQLQRLLEVKGNALILLSNGKIQPNTSRNPDEKKGNLFIWWAPANAFWVGSGMTLLMIMRHSQ